MGKLKEITCKLLVIGAGPGGYVCAIRAGQLGIDTVIVEKAKPGGTCLNVGCIPSKALIHAAEEYYKHTITHAGRSHCGIISGKPELDFAQTLDWKDGIVARLNKGVSGLLTKAGVRSIRGKATFLDGKCVEVSTSEGLQIIRAETVVVATGSEPVELPFMKFGGDVISSTEALSLPEVPNRLAVIGGGYIGLELGIAYAKLGSAVTIIEAAECVLPQYDTELVKPVSARLDDLGVTVLTGAKAKGLSPDGRCLLAQDKNKNEVAVEADKFLVTIGRKPVTAGWGIENLVLDMDGAFIRTDKQCRTSMNGIFAIGDITGEPMLAHRAMAQGEMVAELVAGKNRIWDKYCIPAVCFTDPEVVSVGLSPHEAKEQGIETKIGVFPFQASGRAMTTGREDGFIRIVARSDNHIVNGVQAVGANISELSAGFGLAIEMGARLEDIAQTIHAHPTLSESFQEAGMKALGTALHI